MPSPVADEAQTFGQMMRVLITILVLALVVRYGIAWARRKDEDANKNVKRHVKNEKAASQST